MTIRSRIPYVALLTLTCFAFASGATPAPSAPTSKATETRQILSEHETDARFLGIFEAPCLHRTSLCPDRCNHGGKIAKFQIVNYRRYEKRGEYGDPRAEQFTLRIRDSHEKPVIDTALLRQIDALKPGMKLRLNWTHDYVTRDKASAPERHITSLKPEPNDTAPKRE